MNQPDWGTEMIGQILLIKGRTKLPRIKWIQRRRFSSSGVCYKDRIVICAGRDVGDAKMVLIHEMSHWLIRRGHHHDLKFWITAWELFYLFKDQLNWEATKNRSFRYMKKARVGYSKLGLT